MSIPDNRLSSQVLPGEFLSPDRFVTDPLIDYERGGIALDDGTQGLDTDDWVAFYRAGEIRVGKNSNNYTTILAVEGVQSLSLGFDTNMRATLAWETSEGVFLRWFDTVANSMVISEYNDITMPRLSTDDRRQPQSLSRDIIFAYIKAGNLCYRQQRDRYTIERVLGVAPAGRFSNMGLSRVNRLQFEFRR